MTIGSKFKLHGRMAKSRDSLCSEPGFDLLCCGTSRRLANNKQTNKITPPHDSVSPVICHLPDRVLKELGNPAKKIIRVYLHTLLY